MTAAGAHWQCPGRDAAVPGHCQCGSDPLDGQASVWHLKWPESEPLGGRFSATLTAGRRPGHWHGGLAAGRGVTPSRLVELTVTVLPDSELADSGPPLAQSAGEPVDSDSTESRITVTFRAARGGIRVISDAASAPLRRTSPAAGRAASADSDSEAPPGPPRPRRPLPAVELQACQCLGVNEGGAGRPFKASLIMSPAGPDSVSPDRPGGLPGRCLRAAAAPGPATHWNWQAPGPGLAQYGDSPGVGLGLPSPGGPGPPAAGVARPPSEFASCPVSNCNNT